MPLAQHFLAISLLAVAGLVSAVCDCGFSMTSLSNDNKTIHFTDAIETDFAAGGSEDIMSGWVAQEFNVTAEAGRGEYGKTFLTNNVESWLQGDPTPSELSEERGVSLRVSSSLQDGAVPSAELDSQRLDLHWGSFRAALKATTINGTCGAFFWYFNDTQEIDVEFLSHEFDHDQQLYPIHLVIQSADSSEAGHDASKTDTYRRVNLSFDPTAAFHEYRFDYLPGQVLFYADSQLLAKMKGEHVPTVGGHIILQHWSNGNSKWSGGPPTSDALLAVSYVKAYFNSSDPQRRISQEELCKDAPSGDEDECAIPDATVEDVLYGGRFLLDGQNGSTVADDEQGHHDEEDSLAVSWSVGAPMGLVMLMLAAAALA